MARGRREGSSKKSKGTSSEVKQPADNRRRNIKDELDHSTVFRRSLAASKPTWYSLNLCFSKMVDAIEKNESMKPKSKEEYILRDLRESKGTFFLEWLRTFREMHQLTGERIVRRGQVVCFLRFVDLIVALKLEAAMPFQFWFEVIEGALYDGAFHDVMEWRKGTIEITEIIKHFNQAYKNRDHDIQMHSYEDVPLDQQQSFKPFLDWYCIGSMIQWVEDTTCHLPRSLTPSSINWYQDEGQRIVLLKFIVHCAYFSTEGLTVNRTRSQLRDLSNWLQPQITSADIERLHHLPPEYSLIKIFLDSHSRSDKSDIERLAELLANPEVSNEDEERLRSTVAPMIPKGKWIDLYSFHKINQDMSIIYNFAIQWKLYDELPIGDNEIRVNDECQLYEQELISQNHSPSIHQHQWKKPINHKSQQRRSMSQSSAPSLVAASSSKQSDLNPSQTSPVADNHPTASTSIITDSTIPASAVVSAAPINIPLFPQSTSTAIPVVLDAPIDGVTSSVCVKDESACQSHESTTLTNEGSTTTLSNTSENGLAAAETTTINNNHQSFEDPQSAGEATVESEEGSENAVDDTEETVMEDVAESSSTSIHVNEEVSPTTTDMMMEDVIQQPETIMGDNPTDNDYGTTSPPLMMTDDDNNKISMT